MPVIEVKNVKKYYGDVRGVENLSFEVEEGEIYGFLGPNGAGKTTTVKILVKIIRDYEGTVRVFGKDLREWGKDYYQKIGVSFEFPAVYSKLTALENLEFFASFYKKHLDPLDVLKMVGLDKEADQLVSGFSKGMKKNLIWLGLFSLIQKSSSSMSPLKVLIPEVQGQLKICSLRCARMERPSFSQPTTCM